MEGGAAMGKEPDQAGKDDASERAKNDPRTIHLNANRLESRELFVGTKEITIGHEGEIYRLRLTALNKLILTK